MINTPKKLKMSPTAPNIANLPGFLRISKKASFAAGQKLLPLIAI